MLLVAGLSRPAHARGTYFLVEAHGGLAEPAYDAGDFGLAYGLTAGTTWKLKKYPFRFHLLAGLSARSASSSGTTAYGARFDAARRDVDLYIAKRLGVPIWGPLRIYGEFGIGNRWTSESVRRNADFGSVSSFENELLVIIAGGLQARLTPRFSVGARAEFTPVSSDADLIQSAAHIPLTPNRVSFLGHVGVHF